jgi:hypothetical protein
MLTRILSRTNLTNPPSAARPTAARVTATRPPVASIGTASRRPTAAKSRRRGWLLLASLGLALPLSFAAANAALGATTSRFIDDLALQVRLSDPGFNGFDEARGEALYFAQHTREQEPLTRSCSSCHGKDITRPGRHVRTGKVIDPLALSAAPDRFSLAKKMHKNFKRNCLWVMGRECTAREKGDFLAFVTQPRTQPQKEAGPGQRLDREP